MNSLKASKLYGQVQMRQSMKAKQRKKSPIHHKISSDERFTQNSRGSQYVNDFPGDILRDKLILRKGSNGSISGRSIKSGITNQNRSSVSQYEASLNYFHAQLLKPTLQSKSTKNQSKKSSIKSLHSELLGEIVPNRK